MALTFRPGTAVMPTTEVELSISCRKLQGRDLLSKSDAMCVVFHQPHDQWIELFRTEHIENCHDPDFTRKLVMPYRFEERQILKFDIYDVDSSSPNLADHDFLGTTTCTLGQIVSGGHVQMSLQRGGTGQIIVTAEELSSQKDEVILSFSGFKLDKKDFFGKSDPFLVISKVLESGQYTVVHKTEVIKYTLNPVWRPFAIPVRTLCNGDYDRSLKFTCYDYNNDGSNDLIGEFTTTLRELTESSHKTFECINHEKKKKKKNYTHSGEIKLTRSEIRPIFTFMDYIRGGIQINCTVAIDFTASNGPPTQPQSLHFIGTTQNAYEAAIGAVVSILQDYDSDKMFPVLGFGAKLPPIGRVSHEFFVNMSPDNPYVQGVQGVLQAYRSCLGQIQLYGPTNFSPVIRHVAQFAQAHQTGSHYFVLLILTDGVITDMQQTIQSIVNASQLPMSIIIVGIGNADFSGMEALDADTVCLQSGGVKAERDIVQFVPLGKMQPQLLAREVLAELPDQLTGFMKKHGIKPDPPRNDLVDLPPDPELIAMS